MPKVGCKTGVYFIRNKLNGKVYVGSSLKSLPKRWIQHRSALKRSVHRNTHLQHSWNKYGENSFEFVVKELCNPSLCITREQYWITKLKSSNGKYGYNKSPTAGNTLGTKLGPLSEKRKKEISEFGKEYYKSEEARKVSSYHSNRRWAKPGEREKLSEWAKNKWTEPGVRERRSQGSREMWEDQEYANRMKKSSFRAMAR